MLKQNVTGRVQEFVRAGTVLMAEVEKMNALIQAEVLAKFDPQIVLKAILWIDSVMTAVFIPRK